MTLPLGELCVKFRIGLHFNEVIFRSFVKLGFHIPQWIGHIRGADFLLIFFLKALIEARKQKEVVGPKDDGWINQEETQHEEWCHWTGEPA